MRHIQLDPKITPKVVVLVPPSELRLEGLVRNYLSHIPSHLRNFFCFSCFTTEKTIEGQINVINQFPDSVLVSFSSLELYKRFTGAKTLPKSVGALTEANNKQVQYCAYSSKSLYLAGQLEHNEKCAQHMTHMLSHGTPLVTKTKRLFNYPKTEKQVAKAFSHLLTKQLLGADIETTSLKFYKAKLVSISFAVDSQRGFTFHVKNCNFMYHLKQFFIKYQGRIAWHGGSYDLKVLAHMLFNDDSRELYRTYEDTMLMHYLCTNSPERLPRDLGTLTADLCGEYKLTKAEITNMMEVDVKKVCDYNLDDARGTYWLYELLKPMVHNEDLYRRFKDRQWYLTQTELCGLPVSMERLNEVEVLTDTVIKEATAIFMANPHIIAASAKIKEVTLDKANAKRVKQYELWEVPDVVFNPNSPVHLRILFFDIMKLTPSAKTKTGQPSVDSKALVKLKHLANEEDKSLFDALDDLNKSSKLAGVFLKAVRENSVERNGWYYLHGSYNLGKVVSSRLSSSEPNLQNLPSGTKLGKLFKSIIQAKEGWLHGGSDYSSLEERVNTILTQDPNKKAIYLHGYDGHSYRALGYFPNEMPDIDAKFKKLKSIEDKVLLVNSIAKAYPAIRSKSKAPTFLLQYLGTAYGLQMTCGFTEGEAVAIANNYAKMFSVSVDWLDSKLDEAAERGYVETAYGLRVYCYGITRAVLNSDHTPRIVQQQIRTLGNALCQGYCQMTTEAGMKFLKRVYAAGLQHKVYVSGEIHDAIYPYWVDDPSITKWVNDNLIEVMIDTSDLPELAGDIPMVAELDVHIGGWHNPVTLPNSISREEISKILRGAANAASTTTDNL